MGGDNKLGVAIDTHFIEEGKQFDLAFRRKSSFGLIHEIKSLDLIAAVEKGHQRLAVGLGG